MSINTKALKEQREALVRTIDEFVEYREDNDPDAEILSGLVRVIDELLDSNPSTHTWRVIVDTDYHDQVGGGGIVFDEDFTGTGEDLEDYIVNVVKNTFIGADDENDRAISTIISVRRVAK